MNRLRLGKSSVADMRLTRESGRTIADQRSALKVDLKAACT
jgi:hypothetical protein